MQPVTAKKKTAKQIRSRLLTFTDVKQAIAEGNDKIAEKLGINAGYVLGKAKDILEGCSQDEGVKPVPSLRAVELLGKHIRLWGENAVVLRGVEFDIGPERSSRRRKLKQRRPPALLVEQTKPEADPPMGSKLVN